MGHAVGGLFIFSVSPGCSHKIVCCGPPQILEVTPSVRERIITNMRLRTLCMCQTWIADYRCVIIIIMDAFIPRVTYRCK